MPPLMEDGNLPKEAQPPEGGSVFKNPVSFTSLHLGADFVIKFVKMIGRWEQASIELLY